MRSTRHLDLQFSFCSVEIERLSDKENKKKALFSLEKAKRLVTM
jgi:hypothetical protein